MITKAFKLPKPDKDGSIKRAVGIAPDGKTRPRFFVGNRRTSPAEAERRIDLIRRLYEGQCRRRNADRWSLWTMEVARLIGRGRTVTSECLTAILGDERNAAQSARELISWRRTLSVGRDQDSSAVRAA